MITDGDFIADRSPLNELFPGDIIFYRNRIQLIVSVPSDVLGPDGQGWFDCPAYAKEEPGALRQDRRRFHILDRDGLDECLSVRVGPEGFVLRSDGIWDSPVR